ncbi:MAG: DUF6057 family protein [Tannerella sp.]|jgi:hypothetical protein|nr:DUF6057 family protein [Tannerella sp.]
MKYTEKQGLIAGFITVLALYFIYIYLWINPSLYLLRGFREFFTDVYFFQRFFNFPGNPADYFSRLFIQFYRYPLPASAMISLVMGGIYLLGLYVWRAKKAAYLVAAIPVFVLALMHNDYRHSIRFDVDVLFLLAGLSIFKWSLRHRVLSYVSFPVLLVAVLYLNGILTAALLTAGVFLATLFCRRETGMFLSVAAGIALAAFLSRFMFGLGVHDLMQEVTDASRIYTYRYFPFVLYAAILLPYLAVHLPDSKFKIPYLPVATVAVAFAVLACTSNRDEKNGLSVQHCAVNGQWDAALDYARKCKYPDLDVVIFTNEALHRTGRICDELFMYNQSFGSDGLMSAEIGNYSGILPNQDVFLHLGALSLSIVWGTEATNVYGANPYVLRNLAKAYLAGGYVAEAHKILNLLERTPFDKAWAARYRTFANDTTLIDGDPELQACKQAQAPLAAVATQSVLMNLYLLARDAKRNRMAYDYLLIASLLDHKPEYFASYLSGLKDYGYTTIPKLYLEGLIYYSLYGAELPVDVRTFAFDPKILDRFESFRNDLAAAGRQPDSMKETLGHKYGDTYWYYLLFGSNLSNGEKLSIFNRITM